MNKFNLGDEVWIVIDDKYLPNFKIVNGKVEKLEIDGDKVDVFLKGNKIDAFVKGLWKFQEYCFKTKDEAMSEGLKRLEKRFEEIKQKFKETGKC